MTLKLRKSLAYAGIVGLSMFSHAVSADVLGGEVKISYWNAGLSGDTTEDATVLDFENDLNADENAALELSAALEHPVPILPNVRLYHLAMDDDFDGSFSDTFNGEVFNGDVASNVDMTSTGLTLYYEILDNVVSADVGLDIRRYDGQLQIQDADDPNTVSVTELDETIPLLYAAARADLPFTGFSLGAEVSGLKISDNELTDARLGVRYDISLLFLEAGYRLQNIEIEDVDGIDVSAKLNGFFISTGLDF